jgi:hypothetical protein
MPSSPHRRYGAHHPHFITCSCYRRSPSLKPARTRDCFLSGLQQDGADGWPPLRYLQRWGTKFGDHSRFLGRMLSSLGAYPSETLLRHQTSGGWPTINDL